MICVCSCSCLTVNGEDVGSPEGRQVDHRHQVLFHLARHDAQVAHQLPQRLVIDGRQLAQQFQVPDHAHKMIIEY